MHLGGVQGGGCEVVENVDVVHVCVCWGGGGTQGRQGRTFGFLLCVVAVLGHLDSG